MPRHTGPLAPIPAASAASCLHRESECCGQGAPPCLRPPPSAPLPCILGHPWSPGSSHSRPLAWPGVPLVGRDLLPPQSDLLLPGRRPCRLGFPEAWGCVPGHTQHTGLPHSQPVIRRGHLESPSPRKLCARQAPWVPGGLESRGLCLGRMDRPRPRGLPSPQGRTIHSLFPAPPATGHNQAHGAILKSPRQFTKCAQPEGASQTSGWGAAPARSLLRQAGVWESPCCQPHTHSWPRC